MLFHNEDKRGQINRKIFRQQENNFIKHLIGLKIVFLFVGSGWFILFFLFLVLML